MSAKRKVIKNHSTQDSRVVPHRGTNWAAPWLTSQIGRDAVLSRSYGRGYLYHLSPAHKPIALDYTSEARSFNSSHNDRQKVQEGHITVRKYRLPGHCPITSLDIAKHTSQSESQSVVICPWNTLPEFRCSPHELPV